MEIGLIMWLVFGAISASVGSKKGRSGCGWFIVGFLLGPVGLVLALLVSDENREPRYVEKHIEKQIIREEVQVNQISDDNKKCPYCAEIIKKEAIFCRYCKQRLNEVKMLSTSEIKILDTSFNVNSYKSGIRAFKNQNFLQAVKYFTEDIEENPKNKESYYYRAVSNYKTDKKADAIEDLKVAAQLGHAKSIETLEKRNIAY